MSRSELKKAIQKKQPSFTDSVDGLTYQDIEKNMVIYAKHREDTKIAQKEDTDLDSAKESVKELNAPYKEALKALSDKLAYLNILLREKSDTVE